MEYYSRRVRKSTNKKILALGRDVVDRQLTDAMITKARLEPMAQVS